MSLTHTDVRRILAILDSAEHLESLDVTVGEFQLHARKPGAAASVAADRTTPAASLRPPEPPATAAGTAAASEVLAEVPDGLLAVRSPMVGTFYLRPSPDQPEFVTLGGTVQAGDTVCLVEVMKMFNSVKADITGTVERILVGNGKPVQHGQILLLIKPSKGV